MTSLDLQLKTKRVQLSIQNGRILHGKHAPSDKYPAKPRAAIPLVSPTSVQKARPSLSSLWMQCKCSRRCLVASSPAATAALGVEKISHQRRGTECRLKFIAIPTPGEFFPKFPMRFGDDGDTLRVLLGGPRVDASDGFNDSTRQRETQNCVSKNIRKRLSNSSLSSPPPEEPAADSLCCCPARRGWMELGSFHLDHERRGGGGASCGQ